MRVATSLSILILVGCASERTGPIAITVRDSAGIEIVEHPGGTESSLPAWSVTETIDIGGQDEPGQDLYKVGGAARLSDGRLVVINRSSGQLRFYDGKGKYLSAAGRLGEGPGEFSSYIASVQVLPYDTLFVIDGQRLRATFMTSSGELIRTIPISSHDEKGILTAYGLLLDGRLVAGNWLHVPHNEMDGPVRRDSFAIVLMGQRLGNLDTLVMVPGEEYYPRKGREEGHEFPSIGYPAFGRGTVFETNGRRIVVGSNEPGGIRLYDDKGKLLRIIRTLSLPEPVTEVIRKRKAQDWTRPEEERRFPAVFGYHERVMLGGEGTIWLERQRRYNDEGRRFVVHDSTGRAIATVRCPDRMRPYQVGPQEIIGLWRDPDDVEHVRVYRVVHE
jgi:hypothetical protein